MPQDGIHWRRGTGDSRLRDHALLVAGPDWIGVADVRQSYWRTTEDAEVDVTDGDVLTEENDEAADVETDEPTKEEAEEAWAPEARRILTRVAGHYQSLIEYAELAAEIQESSGIHTRRQVRSWIGPVLIAVARLNHDNDEPALTSLVVHKADGTVGVGFDEALRLSGADEITDPLLREKEAAKARLECYTWAGANVPADGGRPAMSPRFEQIHLRQRKERRALEQPNICPTCFMAIPPTGVCDNCG
jgi:hypothetical protein